MPSPTATQVIPVALPEAFDIMRSWGYEDGTQETLDQFVGQFTAWHLAGDAILLFSNRDLSSISDRPLGIAMPWTMPADSIHGWPEHAPDTSWLPGWRYIPSHFVPPVGAWGKAPT